MFSTCSTVLTFDFGHILLIYILQWDWAQVIKKIIRPLPSTYIALYKCTTVFLLLTINV